MSKTELPFFDIADARKIRKIRSDLKKDLKKGKITLKKIFEDKSIYDYYIKNMKIFDIICSLPEIGTTRALKIMKKLKISNCKKVGGLGKKQKENFYHYFKFSDNNLYNNLNKN